MKQLFFFAMLALSTSACATKTMPGPASFGGMVLPVHDLPGLASQTTPTAPAAVIRKIAKPSQIDQAFKTIKSNKKNKRGDEIARAARHHLKVAPTGYRNDCSGFVMAVLGRTGTSSSGSTRDYWAKAKSEHRTHRTKTPNLGDLVFFDNTYDRNRNRKNDDDLTHIGIVIAVDKQGTIEVAHAGTSRGRTTMKMNLLHPHDNRLNGEVVNDWLRRKKSTDSKGTVYLSGEMFRGFATPPEKSPPQG